MDQLTLSDGTFKGFFKTTKTVIKDNKENPIGVLGISQYLGPENFKSENFIEENTFNPLRKSIISIKNNSIHIWDDLEKILYCNKEVIDLTRNEARLLSLFIKNNRLTLSYTVIYDEVWFDKINNFNESVVKTLIQNLRKKLPLETIKNTYGVGYRLKIVEKT
ncbi:MAG: hypothetical protein COA66_10400 [Arcobacter sp.]|nr:MAG: hypothetical protein COA66_10400 [Arcobacter sp.]